MKSSAHARHGSTSAFEMVATRSVGTTPLSVRRKDSGSIERTRVVGRPSTVKRKLLARNGFGLPGRCTGAKSPGRILDSLIETSRLNVFNALLAPSRPGNTKL